MKPGLLISLLVATACAGGGRNGVGEFEQDVGLATEQELIDVTHTVLLRHQFEIEAEGGAPNIYIETRWLDRLPFPDEQALGIEAVQARVIVRARPRSTTSTLGDTYQAAIRVEQRVRLQSSTAWSQLAATADARAYASRIIADLRRDLDVGIRKH